MEDKCCCMEGGGEKKDCCRTKERSPEEYRKLYNRLSRVEGQIRGLKGMLEKNAYCPDILAQSAAAAAALNAFSRELMDQHIRTCVARDIREGREEAIDDLMAALKKLMK